MRIPRRLALVVAGGLLVSAAAIRALAITCSLGTPDGVDPELDVKPVACPGGGPIYVFFAQSTAATDRAVYFGSEAGPLHRTSQRANRVAAERARACEAA